RWTAPTDYAACQQLAREARSAGIQVIRYQSVRDPLPGACAAVLTHAAFVRPMPEESQTWTLAVFRQRVFWRRDSIFEEQHFDFDAARWTR
ncbi:RES family NAD+ phosphorylase, partial [Noviherbaspirillum denitrificans]|uniref:RES family NAD+ phosphorylase n=1 Tax=Noviherbaspirillum denitrificans TaxID=1968433 RepID=UPI0011311C4F